MISFLALKRREIFPMRPPSSNWLKEIEVFRNRDSDDSYNIPIYPWLAPPLHPKIRSLIERWGVEKEVPANAPVLGHINERVDKLVLVKSGVTARNFGSACSVERPSVAFSVPGRLACGNLNFFSQRPCIGSYYALVPSVVVSIPQSLLFKVCEQDPGMLLLCATEFELINLSDRLGFGAHSRLGAEDRLLAYFLTWSVAFGREELVEGEPWVVFPTPLRGIALQSVVSCSAAALERALGNLKQDGHYVTDNDSARIRLSVLEPIHKWIRNNEEKSSNWHRHRLHQILHETQPSK